MVILGVDGMDPKILMEVVKRYPEGMQNFRWLMQQGNGVQSLGTSTPPQSPVAWSSFITGTNPGGHGIFDFIHRDLIHRNAVPSTTRAVKGIEIPLPGAFKIDVGADSLSNRTGEEFWTILSRHSVPADIWRIPANFPVVPSEGVSFSGMMTPAMDSAYGQCSFYSTDPLRLSELRYSKAQQIQEYDGLIENTSIEGPTNPFRVGEPNETLGFKMYVDKKADVAIIYAGDPDSDVEKVVLKPGQWSAFLRLEFKILPLGMMTMRGICRFYLRSITPNIELYASPVNFDPEDPVAPVSEPEEASRNLVNRIGRYYTQGMAEDVNALKEGVLTDKEFMEQVTLIHRETTEMLDYALNRYVDNGKQGLLFFYFSEIDLASHMMWRHGDKEHPGHDEALSQQDASLWTGRAGSKLSDTVADMYLRIDPALGKIRERVGDQAVIIVMSDHGFAPYRREFSLNTWLYDNKYLILKEGIEKERPREASGFEKVTLSQADWSKTLAYGIGFNGLYLNLRGREKDDPKTHEANEAGIVDPEEAEGLLRELKERLEKVIDDQTGEHPIYRCDLGKDVYSGIRMAEAPDLLVGYNSGFGNSDASSIGRIPQDVLMDNSPANHGGHLGTFNGNHLMHPEIVPGVLLCNRKLRDGKFKLEDLTVEILRRYGIEKPSSMEGRPILE
jgi:predicted AlkP superfamily phosphohydrolase/phosphomutase